MKRQRFWKRLALVGITCVLTGLAGPAWAQESPQRVGKVLDIKGPVLMTNRHQEGRWFQAHPAMNTYISERLRTDDKTTATLEFAIGGRAVVSPGTEIEVVSSSDVNVVGNVLRVKSGAFWASVDDQEQRLQIQTSGGTMGIEGTEFLVEVDEATGETNLVVIEGAVRVNNDAGDESLITPGQKVQFARTSLRAAQYGDPALGVRGLRHLAFDEVDSGFIREALPLIETALRFVPGRYGGSRFMGGTEFYWAMRGLDVIQDPERALTQEAISQISRQAGPAGGIVGGFLRQATSRAMEPPRPVENPRYTAGDRPRFQWGHSKGASKYAVVVARDHEATDTVWYTVTDSRDRVEYPKYGPELTAGQNYYLFVAPLQKDGTPHTYSGRNLGARTTFRAEGFTPQLEPVQTVAVEAAAGPPEISWQPVKGANAYEVVLSSDVEFEEIVWSDKSDSARYRYPTSARGLEEGTFYAQINAYDDTGVLMAQSRVAPWDSVGWESEGLEAVAIETAGSPLD